MKNVALLLASLFLLESASALKCNPSDDCLCLPGHEFEFQCPHNFQDVGGFVIHITEDKEILIDCSSDLKKFEISQLPNITIDKVEAFRMRFCPLPENGFKELLDWFSIKRIELLQFGSFSNVTLTKEHFKGLEFLGGLKLNADSLVALEEDVFANTPNLTSLELQTNHLGNLKTNLFKFIPKLKLLDLSENRFERIPLGLFESLEKLELLHLWGNELLEIDDDTFLGLRNLKSLELSSNKIQRISRNAFKSLNNLQRVNLSMNKLQTVSNIFVENTQMERIVMRSNTNVTLPEYLFSNLLKLQEVDLTNCRLRAIPENIFENSNNIEVLKLGQNKFERIGNLVNQLQNLKEIYLDNNKLQAIGNEFANLQNLKILHLQNNRIVKIGEDLFRDLSSLEEINLEANQIVRIDERAFSHKANLKRINLSRNRYSGEINSSDSIARLVLLENTVHVERVDLSHNLITRVGDVINLVNKVRLEHLDLSYNRITKISVQDLQPLSNQLTIDLKHNNITTVSFEAVDLITRDVKDAYSADLRQSSAVILLGHNPLDCDCYNYDLLRYFQDDMQPQVKVMFNIVSEDVSCAGPPELKDWPLEDLAPQLLTCPFEKIHEYDACPLDCSCSWRPYDHSIVVDCSNANLTEYPEMESDEIKAVRFNQTEMLLQGNNLTVGPNRNLTGYENITKLNLSHNGIKSVDWLPPKLEALRLDNNEISYLDGHVLGSLNSTSLVSLTLNDNPWRCECEAENFTNFLRQHTRVVDAKNILCFNDTLRLIDLNRNDLCHEWQIVNLVLIIMGILLVIVFVFACYYPNEQKLKVWLYAHNMCLWWVTEEELDKEKLYDAFISYSHKDEDFITQNLLPVLEGGPRPYKLCLHYRNWIPGEFITTQVTNSVVESRRTLVVLSPNFLESVWGKMEFRTAHTQAMTEGRARVIIVLYGDIDMNKLDEELKAYMKTNTYVKWGDPYFWNKLKYALPHSKQNVTNNNQKIANVMSCIDDKFKLVMPTTPSPGSTPPIVALDPAVLKKHPLNFVAGPGMTTPPAEAGTLLPSTCL